MNRRGFIARIVALPFVGIAIGRLFGLKPDVKPEAVIRRHTGDRSCCILARLREFEATKANITAEHPMEAAKKRLRDNADANGFLYDPSLRKERKCPS